MNFINLQYHPALRSNLGLALYLLPSALRGDALLFYNFCHELDTYIDGAFFSPLEKEKQLKELLVLLKEKNLTPSVPFLSAECAAMIQRRELSLELLCEIICGMQMDITIQRYETFENLRLYAWRVASAVGLLSATLFGATGAAVNDYAEHLGIALQLTNILRDVAEDATRGRIYLPGEDLQRFNVSEEEILRGIPSPQATHLFDHTAKRALSYFAKADLAWEKIAPAQRHLMRPARLMESIYRTLLENMQRDRYDLFQERYRVSMLKKLALALHVLFS